MKKFLKGLAALATTAALGTGIAFAAGCGGNGGSGEGNGDGDGDGAKVVNYTIVTKAGSAIKTDLGLTDVNNFRPNPFTIRVSVDEDGKILAYVIDTNGSTNASYTDQMPEVMRDGSWFVGKKTSDILTAFGGSIAYDKDGAEGNIRGGLTSGSLATGASQSDFVALQVAAFASSNADDVIEGTAIANLTEYADVIDLANTTVTVVDETAYVAPVAAKKVINYTLTSKKGADIKAALNLENVNNFRPDAFSARISVDNTGKILAFVLDTNGSTAPSYAAKMPAGFRDGSWFVGKTEADILAAFGGSIAYDKDGAEGNIRGGLESGSLTTGASQSDFVVLQMAAFASANAKSLSVGTSFTKLTKYAEVIDIANSSAQVVAEADYTAPTAYEKIAYYTLISKDGQTINSTFRALTPFTARIAVDATGKILAFVLDENGSTTSPDYTNTVPEKFRDGSWFVGKTVNDMKTAFGGSLDYEGINAGLTADSNLTTGASQSSYVLLQMAAFASANAAEAVTGIKAISELTEYASVIDTARGKSSLKVVNEPDYVAPGPYVDATVITVTTKAGSAIKEDLGITGVNNFRPNAFTIKVAVAADGTIISYEIVTNGSTSNFGSRMPASFLDGTWFWGKKSTDISSAFNSVYDKDGSEGNINQGLTSNELATGASQSCFIALQVAGFASANIESINMGVTSVAELSYFTGVVDSFTVALNQKVEKHF